MYQKAKQWLTMWPRLALNLWSLQPLPMEGRNLRGPSSIRPRLNSLSMHKETVCICWAVCLLPAPEDGTTNRTGSREEKWGKWDGIWLQAGLKDHQVLALPVGGPGASLTPPVHSGKMGLTSYQPSPCSFLESASGLTDRETETQPGSCGTGLGF